MILVVGNNLMKGIIPLAIAKLVNFVRTLVEIG